MGDKCIIQALRLVGELDESLYESLDSKKLFIYLKSLVTETEQSSIN